jgi:hypothetical protein
MLAQLENRNYGSSVAVRYTQIDAIRYYRTSWAKRRSLQIKVKAVLGRDDRWAGQIHEELDVLKRTNHRRIVQLLSAVWKHTLKGQTLNLRKSYYDFLIWCRGTIRKEAISRISACS